MIEKTRGSSKAGLDLRCEPHMYQLIMKHAQITKRLCIMTPLSTLGPKTRRPPWRPARFFTSSRLDSVT
jgi:hypothetical protein